ncbi:proline-rich protein 9 [Hyperolius riggenbachi]|uniref:proline-rich protein 9 n=1 Tax=Hyperolius riggenbachi TaxID=752182 RepID=UPI0035A270BB
MSGVKGGPCGQKIQCQDPCKDPCPRQSICVVPCQDRSSDEPLQTPPLSQISRPVLMLSPGSRIDAVSKPQPGTYVTTSRDASKSGGKRRSSRERQGRKKLVENALVAVFPSVYKSGHTAQVQEPVEVIPTNHSETSLFQSKGQKPYTPVMSGVKGGQCKPQCKDPCQKQSACQDPCQKQNPCQDQCKPVQKCPSQQKDPCKPCPKPCQQQSKQQC